MAATEWYRSWFDSPFYHQLYFERNSEEVKPFLEKLLQHLKPPSGSRVLDAGCGMGRHSVLLAERALDVTGIDMAPNSIHHAQQHEKENLHFFVHDLRLPFWINYFDYAFNFYTSFGFFHTRREHDDVARTLAASIKPGGTLLFDYLNVHYVEEHLVHHEVKTIDQTEFELHRWHDAVHFFKKITIRDPSLSEPLQFTEKVSKFSLGDFTDMLAFQKLQVTEVFGDYNLNHYHVRNTPRMIVLANKLIS